MWMRWRSALPTSPVAIVGDIQVGARVCCTGYFYENPVLQFRESFY